MQNAAFSIINYHFDKVNIDLDNKRSDNLSLGFDTSGIYTVDSKIFELIFIVQVKTEDGEKPFISIRCRGSFKFDSLSSFDEIPDFFYRNSIAILFPYVRAYLSLVTTQANIPGVILPTLNL